MQLFLVRHAESVGNLQDIMQGRQDFPLSESGFEQAELVAKYLDQQVFVKNRPTKIYASPLSRALSTAKAIHNYIDVPLETKTILEEVDSGIFSGLTWPQAVEKYPDIAKKFKQAGDWSAVPEGESKVSLWKRADTFLKELQANHESHEKILVVSHGGFIRAMLSVFTGISPEQRLFLSIDNTSVSVIGMKKDRKYILYVNNTNHLLGHYLRVEGYH